MGSFGAPSLSFIAMERPRVFGLTLPRSLTQMRRLFASIIAAGLFASSAMGQAPSAALCWEGGSAVYLAHMSVVTSGGVRDSTIRIDSTLTGASILFLVECPTSFVGAFHQLEPFDTLTPHRWRAAVEAAARESSNTGLRLLLAAAKHAVARANLRSLSGFTDGVFDAVASSPVPSSLSLEPAIDRLALGMFEAYARCEGDEVCGDISDYLVFLLGTHPVAVFKGMRADSATARAWLSELSHQSLAGNGESHAAGEAARRAVVTKLDKTASGVFARERRECLAALRRRRRAALQ